jgi:hypothetical protein
MVNFMAGPVRRKSLKTLIKEVTVGLANTFRNNINENNKNIAETVDNLPDIAISKEQPVD